MFREQRIEQRAQPRRLVRRHGQHARRLEQRQQRLADRLVGVALGDQAGVEGEHATVAVRREPEGMRHAGRDRQHERPGPVDTRFVQARHHRPRIQPQHLVQAVVHVRLDLPPVQAAARLDGFDVQQRRPVRTPASPYSAKAGSAARRRTGAVRVMAGIVARRKCKFAPQHVQAAQRRGRQNLRSTSTRLETTMFTFDPYSPAIDADPFPSYKILRDEHPVLLEQRGADVDPVALRGHRHRRAGLADLFVGQGQPDDRAARPCRRHAGHDGSPAARPSARPRAARVHEAQPREPFGPDPRDRGGDCRAAARTARASTSSRTSRRSSPCACCSPRSACRWATSRRCATRPC